MDGGGSITSTTMNHLSTMYATKRRRRNSKTVRVPQKEGQTKSNPSKRHRERLNAELDTLASLLPFDQNILSKLDKLSILRLSVSYLRTKSYFQAALHNRESETAQEQQQQPQHQQHCHLKPRELYQEHLMDADMILQALNGFLLILTCDGEVFYTSHSVETYLGFHQSDICHQSVYELVHSEDREDLQRHLMWNSQLSTDGGALPLRDALLPENNQLLERNFTVRFRCLLDNTSGFLRLDIRGRIQVLHGQNHKTEDPPLALFALCTPFGPPSLLEMPQKDAMFKSKHKLDLSLVSLDQRAKQVLGYSDSELANKGGYDLVHYDDLAYVASAHQELLKTGASGLIAYRLITKDGNWQWLQTSARLVYKNSKPDFILCTHRPLMEEEGRDLLGKRTMDFKVTYLDSGLNSLADRSGLLSDSDFILRCQRTRRYKSQIRDILTTCRKRKSPVNGTPAPPTIVGGAIPDTTYMDDAAAVAAAATAAAVAGYNNVYPYGTDAVNGIATPYPTPAMPQNLFTAAIDNSRFLTAENFLHYRPISTYYPDYAVQYPSNGYLDVAATASARTCFSSGFPTESNPQIAKDDALYQCQMEAQKFNGTHQVTTTIPKTTTVNSCCDSYTSTNGDSLRSLTPHQQSPNGSQLVSPMDKDLKYNNVTHLNFGFNATDCVKSLKPTLNGTLSNGLVGLHHIHNKEDTLKNSQHSLGISYNDASRDTVVMWNTAPPLPNSNGMVSPFPGITPLSRSCNSTPTSSNGYDTKMSRYQEIPKSQHENHIGIMMGSPCKWSGSAATPKSASPHNSTSPASGKVAPQVTFSNTPFTQDMPFELPLVRIESGRAPTVKQEGNNPLLSISEVTNTLLDHH